MRTKSFSKFKGTMSVLAATAMMVALAACTSNDDGVATLGGDGDTKKEVSQKDDAKAMLSCLQKAGVKDVELMDEDDDQARVNITSDTYYLCAENGCAMGLGGATTDEEINAMSKKYNEMAKPYVDEKGGGDLLIIGERDWTETWQTCLKETGYKEPEYKMDPVEELKQEQAVAEVTAKWAQCARENGFPGVKDPAPPKAGDDEYPMAVIPGKVSAAQLEALAQACPLFDVEAHKAYDDAYKNLKPGEEPEQTEYPQDPSVSLDFAAYGINLEDPEQDYESSAWKEIEALHAILFKAANDYYQAQTEGGSGAVYGG